MGPGPSDMDDSVYKALSRPIIGHLDPEFVKLMDEIKENLRYAFQTENSLTFPVSAPGSAGMESCFVNLLEPGDEVLICSNGVFGNRMLENAERVGAKPTVLEFDWGKPVDPEVVAKALKKKPKIKVVAFVHAETSTGVQSDAKEICKVIREHDALSIMDCVTSLGGTPVLIDEWGVDAAYSGTQKCLSCVPGLSPVTFSERAIERIKKRKTKVQSWFLDLNLVMDYWNSDGKRSYHHTAPVNSLYALHHSLVLLKGEGLENSWKRHQENHGYLRDALIDMDFEYLVEEKYRLPQLNAVYVPGPQPESELRSILLNEYSIEVGGGLGDFAGKIWRIGLMGCSSRKSKIDQLLVALRTKLKR